MDTSKTPITNKIANDVRKLFHRRLERLAPWFSHMVHGRVNHMLEQGQDLPKATIYFDGLCRVCAFEIEQYRRARGAGELRFVDISGADFDADREGVDPHRVHQVMHVKDAYGRLHLGVDAFLQIWRSLPGYRWLARVGSWKMNRAALEVGYASFSRIRPWLPRKSCEASPYCAIPKSS